MQTLHLQSHNLTTGCTSLAAKSASVGDFLLLKESQYRVAYVHEVKARIVRVRVCQTVEQLQYYISGILKNSFIC